MMMIRVGRNVVNLRHVIRTEDDVPAPGSIRVHVLLGDTFDLVGQEAQDLRLALLGVAPPIAHQGVQSVPVDPAAGPRSAAGP